VSTASAVTDRHFVEGGLILFVGIVGFALLWFNGKRLTQQRREKEAAAAAMALLKQKCARQEVLLSQQGQGHVVAAGHVTPEPTADTALASDRELPALSSRPTSNVLISPHYVEDHVHRSTAGSRWGAHAEPVLLAHAGSAPRPVRSEPVIPAWTDPSVEDDCLFI